MAAAGGTATNQAALERNLVMKRDEVFPSRWLKAADVGRDGFDGNVTIKGVSWEEIGEEREEKAVVAFEKLDKELVLNVTNWDRIVELTGQDDSDNWAGYRIRLIRVKVPYGGKTVDAIRIDPPDPDKPKPAPRPARPVSQPAKTRPEPEEENGEEYESY
jgi:hypothetical protein